MRALSILPIMAVLLLACLMCGDGIVKDEVESYAWTDLARFHTRKSPDMNMKWRIRAFGDEVNKTLSPDQIQRGRQRAKTLQAMMTPGQLN